MSSSRKARSASWSHSEAREDKKNASSSGNPSDPVETAPIRLFFITIFFSFFFFFFFFFFFSFLLLIISRGGT